MPVCCRCEGQAVAGREASHESNRREDGKSAAPLTPNSLTLSPNPSVGDKQEDFPITVEDLWPSLSRAGAAC